MQKLKISLHIGAHKTATSHLQKTLMGNEAFCSGLNTKMLPPRFFRKHLAPLESQIIKGEDVKDLRAQYLGILRSAAGDNSRLILSEENIMVLSAPLGHHNLYPRCRRRIRRVRKLIGPRPVRVFMSIRNLTSFLPSVYMEYIRHYPYVTFSQFLNKADKRELSWCDLITRVKEMLFPSDQLFVWTYESYAENPRFVFETLLQTESLEGFTPEPGRVRRGLTAEAMEYVGKNTDKLIDGRAKQLLIEADSIHPRNESDSTYQPLSQAEFDYFQARYQQDIRRIETLTNIHFLS